MAEWKDMVRDWERGNDPVDHAIRRIKEDTGTVLFARTMMVLVSMLGLTGLTSWASWGMEIPTPLFWVLFIGSLILVFVIQAMAKSKEPAALIPVAIFAVIFGVLLGPALAHYTDKLGPEKVTFAVALTTGIMAVCGAVASIFIIPYRKMEGPMLLVLFGLIIYGVVTVFTGIPSREIDLGYSILGAVLFTLYFLVDFARLSSDGRYGVRGWGAAGLHATGLYLDYLNLLLFILRIMGNSSSSSNK